MKALVTGGASGIGAALVQMLEREGYDVQALDLATGFDVASAADWDGVRAVEVACLNAGVITGESDVTALSDEAYRRILGANVDGVVLGTRALARTMAPGGAIVVTASLAGLVPIENDPIYTLTKHAVIGFVRSVAPQLEARGIRVNAVCPGIADTPLLEPEWRERLEAAGFPLLRPEDVAETVLGILRGEGTGEAWPVQPGREPEPFRFPGVPGPRAAGAEGVRPPL